jgi:anti-anti-sigma factor
MTATTFCDSSGPRELLLAHHKATAGGIELRIVMPSADVRRIFQLTGLDQVLLPCDPRAISDGQRR